MYGRRSNGGEHGSVVTKHKVVNFMLDVCDYTATRDLSQIKILDPAAGEGAFVIACIDRLWESSANFQFDLLKALHNIAAIEIDSNRAEALKYKIRLKLQTKGILDQNIVDKIVVNDDYLTCHLTKYNLIIGNPPYVRHENIPLKSKRMYRRYFTLFRERSDLYIAFLEKSLRLLTHNGSLCFILPDRWLRNKYGKYLRDYLAHYYNVPFIINLVRAAPFEEDVYGYPLIIKITSDQSSTDLPLSKIKYLEVNSINDLHIVLSTIKDEVDPPDHIIYRKIDKPKINDLWFFESKIKFDASNLLNIEKQGFKIGIGVATGLDSVFIGKDLCDKVENKLLIPIALSKDIKDGEIKWTGNYIINPFELNGDRLINLDKYPMVKHYFFRNKSLLQQRYVARRNPSKWYRTIDKIDISLIAKPKLLLPDMTKYRTIALDKGEYYPHHNIYYITNNRVESLKLLGAILMSNFSLNQLNNISVKMRGGMIRWQAQNLRKILLPNLQDIQYDIRVRLIELFERKNVKAINEVLEKYLNSFVYDNGVN